MEGTSDPVRLELESQFPIYYLCDLGQFNEPLSASNSSFIKYLPLGAVTRIKWDIGSGNSQEAVDVMLCTC